MNKLKIEENYKKEILKMHGFLKEQGPGGVDDNPPDLTNTADVPKNVVNNTTGTEKKGEEFFKDALAKGCITGGVQQLKKAKDGTVVFVQVTDKGKTIVFYDNYTYKILGEDKVRKWSCNKKPINSSNNVSNTNSKKIEGNVDNKDLDEKKIEKKSAQELANDVQTIVTDLGFDLAIDGCTDLVDNYFQLAQIGQPNSNLKDLKEKIFFCHNKFRSQWKEPTKDKLRWLSGDEESAKKILGLFRKYPKIGSITDNRARMAYILKNIGKIS